MSMISECGEALLALFPAPDSCRICRKQGFMDYLAMLGALGLIAALPILLNSRSLRNERTRNAMRESTRNVTGLGDQHSTL